MKNFKKVLALVLALACLLSFAAVASANNAIKTAEVYDDAASISAEYTEALDVLTAIGVLDGKGSSFKPKDTLKRSEAAKIIAVFANTDPEISSLYASANPFTDVAANHWAVSYIAYAYKTGIIAGVKDGVFAPDARLTGIQFLKMVLCTLGFDAHEEGLVGTSWKVNTLQLAKKIGLTLVLGNSFNYDTEITREAAAQIMLNALNANTVSYGTEVKIASTTRAYETVAGAVANSEFMYQKWGLKRVNSANDPFGRPGHKWLLNNTPFGKDPYTDAPLASYTVKVAGCQILTDCIFDTTNPTGTKTLKVWTDGVNGNAPVTIADTTELRYGNQGTLTEVYEDRIVYINTFLAKVLQVIPGRLDAQGHIIREPYVNAEVYLPTGTRNFSFEGEGFTKDQFVRVTMSFAGAAQAAGQIPLAGGEIITMDAVETKQGVFNGYTANTQLTSGLAQVRMNEEYLNTNEIGLVYNVQGNNINAWMGVELVAFMDQYGNILGLDKYWAALNFGVVDALWLGVENGQAALKADLVTVGGEVLSAVTVATIKDGNDPEVRAKDFITTNVTALTLQTNNVNAAYAEAFQGYYDKLAFFTTNMNGQYDLSLAPLTSTANTSAYSFDVETNQHFEITSKMKLVDFTYVYEGGMIKKDTNGNYVLNTVDTIEFTNGYAWAQKATTPAGTGTTTKTSLIPMNADTVILVRSGDADVPFASRVAGGYTSYTGYANVPSMTAKTVSYYINPTTGYADVIYVCNTSATGTKATVFCAGDGVQVTGITYDSLGNKKYNHAVTVYVVDEATGALTKQTYTMIRDAIIADAPTIGFHTAYVNANNEISFGIDNVNYTIANANFTGKTFTALRDDLTGPDAYTINNADATAQITNVNGTTHGYAFDADNKVSDIAVVGKIEDDVLNGDTVYVYKNDNNPANPIYSVVDVFTSATVYVEVGTVDAAGNWTQTEAPRLVADKNDAAISSYNVGFAGRSWEAAYAVATPEFEVVGMTNGGYQLTKNAYGYFYDNRANAKVGEVVIQVKSIAAANGGATLRTDVTDGGIIVTGNQIRVYGNNMVANLLAELEKTDFAGNKIYLDANSQNATIKVYKNVLGTNPVEADPSDPITTGMRVVVTAASMKFNAATNMYEPIQTVYYLYLY